MSGRGGRGGRGYGGGDGGGGGRGGPGGRDGGGRGGGGRGGYGGGRDGGGGGGRGYGGGRDGGGGGGRGYGGGRDGGGGGGRGYGGGRDGVGGGGRGFGGGRDGGGGGGRGYQGGRGGGGGGRAGGGRGPRWSTPEHVKRQWPSSTDQTALLTDTAQSRKIHSIQTYHPLRPGPGKIGAKVTLKCNHFLMENTCPQAFHYDVNITDVSEGSSDRPDRGDLAPTLDMSVCRVLVMGIASRWTAPWAYDGRKTIMSSVDLTPGQASVTFVGKAAEDEGKRPKDFQIVITLVNRIDLNRLVSFINSKQSMQIPQDSLLALDVVLKHSAGYRPGWYVLGRQNNLLFPPQDMSFNRDIGLGAEVWLGYNQTLRPVQCGLTVTIDLSTTAFIKAAPVMDYLVSAMNLRGGVNDLAKGLSEAQKRTAKKALSKLKVQTTHQDYKRTVKVSGLEKSAVDYKFDCDGKTISVAEYFKNRYKKTLKYPKLPLLNVGTKNKPNCLPMEVCVIKAGQRRSKLEPSQTSAIILHAAKEPAERMRAVEEMMQKASIHTDPLVAKFGLKMNPKMLEVQARVLPPPMVTYKDPRSNSLKNLLPEGGAWNLQNCKLYEPAQLNRWAIVVLEKQDRVTNPRDGPEGSLNAFLGDFQRIMKQCGLHVEAPSAILYRNGYEPTSALMTQANMAISQRHQQRGQLILVILPDTSSDCYKEVKFESDCKLGVPSQCLLAQKANIGYAPRRPRDQYLANVALKINAKLGGVNSLISASQDMPFLSRPDAALSWIAANFESKPFMILGADVTHSVVKSENARSIAAVVGSLNKSATRYSTRITVQPGAANVEIIGGLKEALKGLLRDFYNHNRGKKPERLIMYRDGVAESQFETVIREEMTLLKQACHEMGAADAEYSPKITYIIVQKRHHTVFFPNPNEADASGNILPGTVVDSKICHPHEFDFYLCSHGGLKGTSRPAHYHVIVDENGFSSDCIQLLTFRFCHMYCRATRSVSIPPPAYYAHLAAFRGRMLLGGDESDARSTSQASELDAMGNLQLADVHEEIRSTMFYV